MTREASAARNPTGKTVPSVIGTSPKTSPGSRSPTTRSIPSVELDRLDATVEQGEERALAALGRRELAGQEADVGRRAGEPLALGRAERGEDRDSGDLLGGHHDRQRYSLERGLDPLEAR